MSPVFSWALGGFFGLGALAMLLTRLRSRSDETFLRRYLWQGLLVLVALGPVALGVMPSLFCLWLLGVVCAHEVASVACVSTWGAALCSALVLGASAFFHLRTLPSSNLILSLALLSVLAPWLMSRAPALRSRGALWLFASLWPACSIVAFMTLSIRPDALLAVGFLYGVLEVSDSVAYIVGRSFGKRKLAPRLSPHKTWEGFLAGLLAAALASCAFTFCLPELSLLQRFGLGLFLGLWGVLSDLSVSVFKRARGVKDYSTLLGPHGGVLDAYDSFLLTGSLWAYLLSLYTSSMA